MAEPSGARGPTAARAVALRVLLRVDRGEFANAALERALSAPALRERERALVTALVDGTLRWRGRVDYALERYAARPLDALTPAIRTILRLGAFQILFMNAIPAHAACDEAVRMARTRGHEGTAGLVNAVLRRLAREGEPPPPDRAADVSAHIAIAYSHPQWLVRRWIAHYGAAVAQAICEADNRPAAVCLRTNSLHNDAQELARRLGDEGVETAPSPLVRNGLRVTAGGNPARARAYRAGRFTIQGEASIVVGQAAAPSPGWRALDLCAGVGGKTTHMAEIMHNQGQVVAVDRQGRRLARLKEECARLGIAIIETAEGDALTLEVGADYDLCLVDAPCSGTGALRRRPDSRWRKTEEQIARLASLQRDLLARALLLVRPGGVVVYSVCSLEPEEGEQVVRAAAEGGRGAVEDCRGVAALPESAFTAQGAVSLMPHVHDCDGMFIARLRARA